MSFDLWPIGLVGLPVGWLLWWRQGRPALYVLCATLFYIYGVLALQQVFFPVMFDPAADGIARFNLIPFSFGRFGTLRSSLLTLALNVLLTMPFGFGINGVARTRPHHFVWMPLAVVLGLEAGQLLLSLITAPPYRTVDINDVIMNGLGVLIGYALFRLGAWGYQRWAWGWSAYVDEVTRPHIRSLHP